ncbi:MAG: histidine phosphatase family protein [Planctomycetaceae bacterium]|jgi:probable phosphoglycerate mutase
MSTIVLIRAGCTDYEDAHRLLGNLSVPLNARGTGQIREVVQRVQQQGLSLEVILTSPEDPACGTAHEVARAFPRLKVKEQEELRNVNQGLWQGLPENDVRRRFPRFFRSGKEDPTAICPPEGETLSDACQRIEGVLSRALRRYRVFAVVAPEPLASVIRCTVLHRRMRMTECLCGTDTEELVQVLQSSSFESSGFAGVTESCGDCVPLPGQGAET